MPVSPDTASAATMCDVHVEVGTARRPTPGPKRHTYLCDAGLLVSEGAERKVFHERLTVHHPRGWMGVAAAFDFRIDSRECPTFDERAAKARVMTLDEFPDDELISVFLLGTGTSPS